MRIVLAAAAAGLTMLVLDAIWLTVMAPTYRRLFGDILLENFRLGPAAAFYLLYIAGLTVLVVAPALREDDGLVIASARGALFGLIAYGTYALSNYATLKAYGPTLALMDLCWGAIITGTSTLAAVAAGRFLSS